MDLLGDFEDNADPGLLDHIQMQQELEVLLGRKAGRVAKRALEGRANGLFLRS